MKKRFLGRHAYLAALFLGIALIAYVFPATGVTSTSLGEFNVTPNNITLNWTNSNLMNITITANFSNTYNITVLVRNTTAGITGNYSQHILYANNSRYNASCFPNLPLLVMNASGAYINTTALLSNTSSPENLALIFNATCPPGRYFGNVTLSNSTNAAEQANITALIDIPITSQNELNTTTGIAFFNGTFNGSGYHSYYLNMSQIWNAKGISIRLDWGNSSKDLDMFLLNSTNYLARSIGNSSSTELINYTYPAGVVEIRVAANITSPVTYNGTVYFTTLNITNATANSTLPLLDFGALNVSDSRLLNMTIRNDGNLTLSNIEEIKEIYRESNYTTNATANFSVVVPSYATKIKAFVTWRGSSTATLNLFMPNGTLAGSSSGKRMNANISGFTQEEYVETTQIAASGVWKVGVVNISGFDNYTVKFRFWVSPNSWIYSNYTTSSFNITGVENYTKTFPLNFTVPATALGGYYTGYIGYANGSAQLTELRMNVTSAVLVVNNTLQSDTIYLRDVIGFNKTEAYEINLTISNTGNTDITFETGSNSSYLSYGSYKIMFSFSYPGTINAGQSGNLRINFTVNTDNTSNQPGVYRGWTYLNATEAYPYQGFNLSMQFNLTNYLNANITNILSLDGNTWMENASGAENMTVYINISYPNGTAVTDLLLGNFSIWLTERNVTEYRYPASSNLTLYNLSGLTELNSTPYSAANGRYEINFTVPANLPGGVYRTNMEARTLKNNITLLGTDSSVFLTVNSTGLNMTQVTDKNLGTVNEGGSAVTFNMSVRNFGPVTATGNLTMSSCSYATVAVSEYGDACRISQSGAAFRINITGNGTEFCWYKWSVTPVSNVSSTQTCTFTINATDPNFGNITGITLTVNDTTTGGGGGDGGGGGTTSCSTNADCAWNYYCIGTVCKALSCAADEEITNHACVKKEDAITITDYGSLLDILPGSMNSTSVTVKNTGNKGAFTAKLAVITDSSIESSVTPSSCSLGINATCTFNVTVNSSTSASIGNHTGTFKAYKSDAETVKDEKTFVVRVAATAERIEYLKKLYQNVSENLTKYMQLFVQINSSAAWLNMSSGNITPVEAAIKNLNTTLMLVNAYIYNGSYDLADSMLSNIAADMTTMAGLMETLKKEYNAMLASSGGGIFVWVAIGVVIAAVGGFIVYLFLPPSGYSPRHGYTQKSETRKRVSKAMSKMAERAKKIREIKVKKRRR